MNVIEACFHCSKTIELKEISEEIKKKFRKEAFRKEHRICKQCEEVLKLLPDKTETAQKKIRKVGDNDAPITTLCENIVAAVPMWYDMSRVWWMWDFENHSYKLTDETEIMTIVKSSLFKDKDRSVRMKSLLAEGLRQEARMQRLQQLNKEWIQFGKELYNINTGSTRKTTYDFFNVNPIPWTPGKTSDTPVMDKLFSEWVGDEYKQTLYELIAYCCYRHYPIHLVFALVGHGRNGKSQFLSILNHFLTPVNIASSDLENLMENRFETFNLFKKLACVMGETNFSVITKTDLIKRLSGGDLIRYEKKGADTFSDYNYTKIIMATNSLPSSEDTSDGWFRRWLIIDFPNEYEESSIEIWTTVPEQEYHNLAKKVLEILPELLKRGKFTNQGSIEQRTKRYIEKSNPLATFIKERCYVEDPNEYVLYSKLYLEYVGWLQKRKMRKVTRREFSEVLENQGFEVMKTSKKVDGEFNNNRFVLGIRINFVTDVTVVLQSTLENRTYKSDIESQHNGHNSHKSLEKPEFDNGSLAFFSKNDLKSTISELSKGFDDKLVPFEELKNLYPGHPVEDWLKQLISDGDVYSPRPNKYGVLE